MVDTQASMASASNAQTRLDEKHSIRPDASCRSSSRSIDILKRDVDGQAMQSLLLQETNQGLDLLLNGRFDDAVKLMQSRPESPWHCLSLGMIGFLQAALGLERKDLDLAQAALYHAEQLATSSLVVEKSAFVGWWRPSTESQVIQADALVLQAMCLMLSESKLSFINCAWKLNKTYRICSRTFAEVLPGVSDGMSVEAIGAWIEALYKSKVAFDHDGSKRWSDNVQCSYVVTAACYQRAMFDMLFSLLPPSAQTLTNLLYKPSDRKTAVNLLKFAAQRGSGVHSVFASLALLVFDTMTLQFSPWVADPAQRVFDCEHILTQRMHTHPKAALWRWHCAKLSRARGDVGVSCDLLKDCIESRQYHFPQAEVVLTYELLWSSFALGDWYQMLMAALKLTTLNEYGTATYEALALGALQLMSELTEEQAEIMHDLIENKMPASVVKSQALGHKSPGQKFVARRLEQWQERLSEAPRGTRLADVVSISPALELGLHFNIFSECTPQTLTLLLRSLSMGQEKDAQTGDRALRSLLKGAIHSALGRYHIARPFLEMASATSATTGPYAHVKPLALCELASLELKLADVALAPNDQKAWTTVLDASERRIAEIASKRHYDLNMRLGVRLQAFRMELDAKRDMLKATHPA